MGVTRIRAEMSERLETTVATEAAQGNPAEMLDAIEESQKKRNQEEESNTPGAEVPVVGVNLEDLSHNSSIQRKKRISASP